MDISCNRGLAFSSGHMPVEHLSYSMSSICQANVKHIEHTSGGKYFRGIPYRNRSVIADLQSPLGGSAGAQQAGA